MPGSYRFRHNLKPKGGNTMKDADLHPPISASTPEKESN